jgi:hypothetical protein
MVNMTCESPESLQWLLNLLGNFDPQELESMSMKPVIGEHRKQIETTGSLLAAKILTYARENKEFAIREFSIIPNILLLKFNDEILYLLLSGCTVSKKVIFYKET